MYYNGGEVLFYLYATKIGEECFTFSKYLLKLKNEMDGLSLISPFFFAVQL